jgi:putative lipoic acid-binding regulatory protein
MTGKESLIEFPCAFPIKAMGLAADDFDTLVVSLVRLHATDLSEGAIKTKASANGKYLSVTVTVNAINQEQLDNIYRELTSHDRILMTF